MNFQINRRIIRFYASYKKETLVSGKIKYVENST